MSKQSDIVETLRYLQKTNEFSSVGSEAVDKAVAEIERLRERIESVESYALDRNTLT